MDKEKQRAEAKKAAKQNNLKNNKLLKIGPVVQSAMYEGQAFDCLYHAWLGRFTSSVSPASFILALVDWLAHLEISPAKQTDLRKRALKKYAKFNFYIFDSFRKRDCDLCVKIKDTDHRFQNELCNEFPFNLYSQWFLLCEQWWDEATTSIQHSESISKAPQMGNPKGGYPVLGDAPGTYVYQK